MKKTILITGASRGIGRAIALESAAAGYNLVLTCKSSIDLLEEVKEMCSQLGATCLTFIGDMGDESTVKELFITIDEYFNEMNNQSKNQSLQGQSTNDTSEMLKESMGIDILVNNVGISHVGLLTDTTTEQWNTILSTNLSSVFYCSKGVIPHMLSRKSGKIFNISSIWGQVGASCEVAYSATKGGVDAFTKALAKELAPSNIQVNALSLGVIDTEMNACFTENERQALTDEIPMGRMGRPEEVAEIIISMMEGKEYMTGQIVTIDGGFI